MDNLYYIIFTNIVILISFVVFIVLLTVHIVKKSKPKVFTCFIFIFCLLGMYLFIPSRYLYLGYAFQSPDLLQKAIKYSIVPYEKRLCYLYLADIYEYDIFHGNIKNGNLAIEYLEKAINGEYSKYRLETIRLSTLYSLKGDIKKTLELNDFLNHTVCLPLFNVYIIQDQYEKALEHFSDKNNCTDMFLKADLYKKLGKNEEAEAARRQAELLYDDQLGFYAENSSQRLDYISKVEKYKTIETYKNWLNEQAKEFKF